MFRSICLFHSVPTWITHMFFWCDSLDLDAAMSKFDSLARNCTWPITSSAAFRTAVVSRDAQGTCTAHEHQRCQPRIHKPFFMNDGGILQIVIICVKYIYILYIIWYLIGTPPIQQPETEVASPAYGSVGRQPFDRAARSSGAVAGATFQTHLCGVTS